MKSKQIRMITHGAILAALYVALTYLQNIPDIFVEEVTNNG